MRNNSNIKHSISGLVTRIHQKKIMFVCTTEGHSSQLQNG